MSIEIKTGKRPAFIPPPKRPSRLVDVYEAITGLQLGQWFEVPGSAGKDTAGRRRGVGVTRGRLQTFITKNQLDRRGVGVAISAETNGVVVFRVEEVAVEPTPLIVQPIDIPPPRTPEPADKPDIAGLVSRIRAQKKTTA